MSKFMVKSRKLVVGQELYTYSIKEGMEGVELLVYQSRQPVLRLRQNWVEGWGIDFFRPRVVEWIIKHYRRKRTRPDLRLLCQERDLFLELANLCFSQEEQAEKDLFIQSCEDPKKM